MSFSQSAKHEVLKQNITDDYIAFAFLSGIIKGAGLIKKSKHGYLVEINTDLEKLSSIINDIISQYYGEQIQVVKINDYISLKQLRYKIIIPENVTNRLFNDLSITEVNDTNSIVISRRINKSLLNDDDEKRAFIKGIFVACATSNIIIKNYSNTNTKNTSGYHLEFVFSDENLAKDFMWLLEDYQILSKFTLRKGSPIVYIKEYQVICDVLALVGAVKAVLSLQNEAAIREVRNNVNRQVNCFNANLSKMVRSSVRQLDAINYIKQTIGLENLEEPLLELAILRIANPEEPLEKLRALYSYPISKSGINHRLEKIIKIANKLKEEHKNL